MMVGSLTTLGYFLPMTDKLEPLLRDVRVKRLALMPFCIIFLSLSPCLRAMKSFITWDTVTTPLPSGKWLLIKSSGFCYRGKFPIKALFCVSYWAFIKKEESSRCFLVYRIKSISFFPISSELWLIYVYFSSSSSTIIFIS